MLLSNAFFSFSKVLFCILREKILHFARKATATIISKDKFDEIWNTGVYNESLTAT